MKARKQISSFALVSVAAVLAIGCELLNRDAMLVTVSRRDSGWQDGLLERPEPVFNADTAVYVTAVRYPPDYDWLLDTAYASVDARLVLFRNGEEIAEYVTGPAECISVDADMHRVVSGHLYTDYSTDIQTVIKCDGSEILRWDGRETIRGFLVYNDEIHTLGVLRDGRGFVYRVNGKDVLRRADGWIVDDPGDGSFRAGGLYVDNGRVCFAYYVGTEAYTKRSWYMVTDGYPEEIALPAGVHRIFDVRLVGGSMWMACSSAKDTGNPLMYSESQKIKMDEKKKRVLRSCRLAVNAVHNGSGNEPGPDTKVFLKGEESIGGKAWNPFIFNSRGNREFSISNSLNVMDFYLDGPNWAYIWTDASGKVGVVRSYKKHDPLEPSYLPRQCVQLAGSSLYLAVTPRDTVVPPYVWKNGVRSAIPIHGYLTGLYVERVK